MFISFSEETFTVKSDYLSDFTGISTVKLRVKYNCEVVDTLTIVEADVTSGEFEVAAADMDLAEFSQGIWGFTLVITNDDDTVQTEYACHFVDIDLNCKVAKYSNSDESESARLLVVGDYVILQHSGNCPSDCEDYCTIYERLNDVLLESSC